MKVLRTPDDRFVNLPDYPFEPNYVEVPDNEGGTLRIHYVDEGPKDGNPVILMHGEPTWSYLYRKMIPIIVNAGFRAIAPDLVGFGRSDKPADRNDYTYERHVDWMMAWLEKLNLREITLVCQDWGGLIGLRLVANQPDLFARVVAANTGLPTGDNSLGQPFLDWRKLSQDMPEFEVGLLMQFNTISTLSDDVIAAYNAPFPDESYKEGARIFPLLVPIEPSDPVAPANRKAWEVLSTFNKPFLTTFSDGDPITRSWDEDFLNKIPGAKEQPHTTIKGAAHFLQEDSGEEFAKIVTDFISNIS